MKIKFVALLIVIPFIGYSQDKLILSMIPNNTDLGWQCLVLKDSNENILDTLYKCPNDYELIDYFIKSPDSVSVIWRDYDKCRFRQFIFDHSLEMWKLDSITNWHFFSPTDPKYTKVTYRLKNYSEIIKVKNNIQEDFPIIKNKASLN